MRVGRPRISLHSGYACFRLDEVDPRAWNCFSFRLEATLRAEVIGWIGGNSWRCSAALRHGRRLRPARRRLRRRPKSASSMPGIQPRACRASRRFCKGWASKGYVDGRNITLVTRNAELKSDRFEPLARELVGRHVRVLFAKLPRGGSIRARGHQHDADRGHGF